jgi:hypothetical protein
VRLLFHATNDDCPVNNTTWQGCKNIEMLLINIIYHKSENKLIYTAGKIENNEQRKEFG